MPQKQQNNQEKSTKNKQNGEQIPNLSPKTRTRRSERKRGKDFKSAPLHAPFSVRSLKEKLFKDIWKKRKEIIIAALFAVLFFYFILMRFLQ